jgi:hypothetical protein
MHLISPTRSQTKEIKQFFRDFDNHYYSDLVNSRIHIVDTIVSLSSSYVIRYLNEDTLLSQQDVRFIKYNVKNSPPSTWTRLIFPHAIISDRNELLRKNENAWKSAATTAYFELSLPYFNKRNDKCVIYYSFYCGWLCAESSLRLYKKIKGHWIFVKNYTYIVS